MLRRCTLLSVVLALLGGAGAAIASPAAPGDTASTPTLFANFDTDLVGQPPDVTLPGGPSDDYLTLTEGSGTVRVNASIDGLVMAAQMKQQSGPGGVGLAGWLAPAPAGTETVTVGWRSVAQDDNPITFVACALRSSNGAVIASVEYTPHGVLTWNGVAGDGRALPIAYQQNRNIAFRLAVDLLRSRVSLVADGVAVPGFQDVPFAQPAADVARISFEAGGTSPQTFAVDDIWAVDFSRVPDRAPVVTAPATASVAEGASLVVTAAAADPDGQPITSFTAAPLPSGASFSANATNTSGTLTWTPGFAQAGSYSVTFAAANALTGSAVTAITVTNQDRPPVVAAPASAAVEELGHIDVTVTVSDPDGDPIDALTADLSSLPAGSGATFAAAADNASGTFSWTPALGEAGEYPVVFQASANGALGSATTNVFVAVYGTAVTGRFVWTPQAGEEGSYVVTFVATDAGGMSSLAVPVTVLSGGAILLAPAPRPAARTPAALAPEMPTKGPVISVVGSGNTKTGSTLTLTATATSSTTLLAGRPQLAGAPEPARAAAVVITLTADLSGLPSGNDALFVVDKDPIVNAPALKQGDAGLPLTVDMGADDPDGDPILRLTADWSGLPAGNDAAFATNASHTLGTFTWTPALADSGSWTVTFQAANRLVQAASTVIQVRGAAPARLFAAGAKKLNLGSSKPYYALAIEPVGGSFLVTDVDPLSIRMISSGTGALSEIGIAAKTQGVIGDRDKNQVEDLTVSFAKSDLRQLFSLLRGTVSVPVVVQGNLITGGRFRGALTIDVGAGSGQLAAIVVPNPLNPTAVLRFATTRTGDVSVRLFDVSGRMVRELLPRTHLGAGDHEIAIGASDASGRGLASGVYFYRIDSAEGPSLGRVAVVK